jgi:hypothetical protein
MRNLMIATYYSLGAMVVKFFANFLQITRRMTGVLFPAHRFCPMENASPLKTQPGVWTPKIMPRSNRTRRSIRPCTHWLHPETFDGSLVASTPPRGPPDHGQGHPPQPTRRDRRANPRRQSSVVLYCLTAANDLGLTDAVPTRIGELTDGHMRPINFATLSGCESLSATCSSRLVLVYPPWHPPFIGTSPHPSAADGCTWPMTEGPGTCSS